MEFSYHIVILLLGVAVAGLSLLGAIAVGPYGRRGLRAISATISIAAFLGTAFWGVSYLGFIEQRRSIEARLSELRGQALSAGSPLACSERTGDALEAACAQALFATPETLAAANVYTAARLDLLTAAARYAGPRMAQFDDAINALRISLQQDPFGLTAHILVTRKGCTAERCDDMAMFGDPARLQSNIRQKAFEANMARYAANWRTSAPAAAASSASDPVAPAGSETRAPIPEKYSLPSAASIPPVSIMNDEPADRPEARDRATPPRQPAAASPRDEQVQAPAALPSAPASGSERPAPARRERPRPNAPLSISPTR